MLLIPLVTSLLEILLGLSNIEILTITELDSLKRLRRRSQNKLPPFMQESIGDLIHQIRSIRVNVIT